MPSPMVSAVISSAVLTATGNILAQFISAYRTGEPFSIDWRPLFKFVLFSLLNGPPNFAWQQFLEATFPRDHQAPSASALRAAAAGDEKELDREEKSHTITEPRLNKTNVLIKFLLDQIIGATLNTVMFTLYMPSVNGGSWDAAVQNTRESFWPIMQAGWRLWPAVSLVSFALIKTVEMRTLVGSIAGVGWSIIMSLMAAE